MPYEAKLRRQAVRLGIVLPSGQPTREDDRWSSDGFETLFEGPCKLDYVQQSAGWSVSLRRSGKRGGYRKVAECRSLEEAMALASFLRKPANRRAFRGLSPKVKAAPQPKAEDVLVEALRKVNGGAVQVTR